MRYLRGFGTRPHSPVTSRRPRRPADFSATSPLPPKFQHGSLHRRRGPRRARFAPGLRPAAPGGPRGPRCPLARLHRGGGVGVRRDDPGVPPAGAGRADGAVRGTVRVDRPVVLDGDAGVRLRPPPPRRPRAARGRRERRRRPAADGGADAGLQRGPRPRLRRGAGDAGRPAGLRGGRPVRLLPAVGQHRPGRLARRGAGVGGVERRPCRPARTSITGTGPRTAPARPATSPSSWSGGAITTTSW